jgi:hypothetical protein
VVACLQEVDEVISNAIDQSVPGCDSARPDVGSKVLQRFRLSNSSKRISPCVLHQLEDSKSSLPIGGYPMLQVLHAFVLNDGDSRFLSRPPRFLAPRWHREDSSVGKAQFVHEGFEVDRGDLPALGTSERCEQSGGISRGPEKVGSLLEAGEFVGWNEGHGFMAAAFQDGRFAAVLHFVPDSGEIRAGAAISGSGCHALLPMS